VTAGPTRRYSDGFSTLSGSDRTFNGGKDAFVVRVKPDGSGLSRGSCIGGDRADEGAAVPHQSIYLPRVLRPR